MQVVVNSANIGTLNVAVSFDIANRKVIWDTSASTYNGSGASAIKGIFFSLIDQDGVVLETINLSAPQIVPPVTSGNWIYTTDLSSVNYAFLFQQYSIQCAIQDSNGTVYYTNTAIENVCQPVGFCETGTVPGLFQITPDCVNNVLTVKELTLLVYNNQQPTSVSKTGILNYPTGSIGPVNFSNTPFSNSVVYTGQYNITCTTVGTYTIDSTNQVFVLVTYYTNNVFNVTCQNKMSDLLCCVYNLQQTAIKRCSDAVGQNAQQQLDDISTYLLGGFIAEKSGQDACFYYDYIKKTLGCNCGANVISQNEFTPINPAVTSIVLQGVGGTTIQTPTVTGNTTTYPIQSNFYQVVKGNSGDTAFTITIDTSVANTVKYVITFNYAVMAASIYTATAASPTLLAQFNQLIQEAVNSIAGLNGGCIINLSQATYIITQNVTISTGITNIVINGGIYPAPTGLLAINAAAVATWLNSLALGTFNVGVTGGILTISTVNNPNTVSTITFTTPNVTQQFAATSFSLTQVLQAIINYVCSLTASQVALGVALGVCSFDYNGNIVNTTYSGNQGAFNSGIAAAICSLVARINTLTQVTCATIQSIFGVYPNAVFNPSSDTILSVVGGNCTQMNAQQAALGFIATVNAFANVKTAFCAINCSTPAACPDVSNVNLGQINQTSVGLYGVTWSVNPTASQTVTVKYRVNGNLTWITANSGLLILPNGNISGSSPYVITGLTAGTTYQVWVQNNCGGNGFVGNITTPSSTLYTANYLLANNIYSICGVSPTTLYSSVPFGIGVTLYVDSGLTTPITGYVLVAPITTGSVYALNTSTGVVGAATGNMCSSGTAGTYILGNSTGSICSNAASTYYTNGAFAVGGTLYVDSALTTPVTGSSFVVNVATGHIFNLNSSTGIIGSDTGLACSSTTVIITTDLGGTQISGVTGIVGFTPTPSFPLSTGGTITGTHSGYTGTIAVTFTGTPAINGNVTLEVNGVIVQCIPVSAAGTFTFNSRTYASTDVINLQGNTGSC
jgi:hypothetical protein